MRRSTVLFPALALLAGAALGQGGARGGADPEPSDAQARAVAALGGGVVLGLAGETKGIAGMTSAVGGTVKGVDAAIADLHARVIGQEIHIELSADVLFDFDKANIRPAAAEQLAKAATIIRGYPDSPVRVEGHTDSKGDDAYNQHLSERRAQAVVSWLRDREGLSETRFSVRGFGETRPVVPNAKPDGADDPAGRQKNRRVEIVVTHTG